MFSRTMWQLVLIFAFLAMSPLFVLGLVCGVLGYFAGCGYFWGQRAMDLLYDRALGSTATWKHRVTNRSI